jgi:serine/threonine-protein kinase
MIGQKFGHYLIEQKLGEGGMGVVYRARDEKLQRDVALKFLDTLPTGGSAGHERVLQEARAISALNHPNICTIYEVGEIDEKPYIAMEFVEGRPLSMEIPSNGMGLEQVERHGMQLADALGHAHGRGIIHRDLKAANVMVTPQGRLKVLDFGISRRLEPGKGLDGTTQFDKSWESQHTFTGTLPYVAPEILRGEDGDARSDIWSLGVLLYEMAGGRRPFRGSTGFELSAAILRERAPQITPPLPPILQSVIDRCLDKDPGQRYQSAGEVRAALEAATTGSRSHEYLHVLANREGEGKKHTIRNILVATIALLLLASAAYWYSKSTKPKKPKTPMVGAIQSIAVLPLENLSGDPAQDYFADGMTDALITELSQIKKLRVISRTSVMQYKRTRKPLQDIAQELNVDAVVEGSVVRAGRRVRISAKLFQTNVEGALWADNFERNFTDVLALQNDVAAAIAHSIQVELSGSESFGLGRNRSVVPEAYEEYLRGRYEAERRTQASVERAVQYFQSAIQKDETFAAAHAGLAEAYLTLDSLESGPSHELAPKATEAVETALKLDNQLAEAHTSLAGIRFFFLQGGDIEEEFRRAIALDPGYAPSLHWYSLFLAASGRFEEAIHEIKLAREIDPKSMIIQANVGWIYYLARDYDHAIETEKKVLQVDPSFEPAHSYLGQAYLAKEDFVEAVDEFRIAASLSPGSLSGQANLAAGYARAGDKKAALEILREIEAHETRQYVSPYDLALIHAGFSEVDATVNFLEKAYAERNARLVNLPVHPHFAFLIKNPRFIALSEKVKAKLH